MDPSDPDLLAQLRLTTHYAGFRQFVHIAAITGYLITTIYVIAALFVRNAVFGIASLLGATGSCIGIYLISQAALILADIADAALQRLA